MREAKGGVRAYLGGNDGRQTSAENEAHDDFRPGTHYQWSAWN